MTTLHYHRPLACVRDNCAGNSEISVDDDCWHCQSHERLDLQRGGTPGSLINLH